MPGECCNCGQELTNSAVRKGHRTCYSCLNGGHAKPARETDGLLRVGHDPELYSPLDPHGCGLSDMYEEES